jgi:hypothetical protein
VKGGGRDGRRIRARGRELARCQSRVQNYTSNPAYLAAAKALIVALVHATSFYRSRRGFELHIILGMRDNVGYCLGRCRENALEYTTPKNIPWDATFHHERILRTRESGFLSPEPNDLQEERKAPTVFQGIAPTFLTPRG